MRRDADLVGSVLGVTLAEGQVAILLAEGRTVPDIAVLCGQAQTTLRTTSGGFTASWAPRGGWTCFTWSADA